MSSLRANERHWHERFETNHARALKAGHMTSKLACVLIVGTALMGAAALAQTNDTEVRDSTSASQPDAVQALDRAYAGSAS